jgi:hypothetical protein
LAEKYYDTAFFKNRKISATATTKLEILTA